MNSAETISFIAADTSRSRAYAQALLRHGLMPAKVVVLADANKPGQLEDDGLGMAPFPAPWGDFYPQIPIMRSFEEAGVACAIAPSPDVNAPETIAMLVSRPETVFIYSGFGGVILRSAVLSTGKEFLHVHGGYLPRFKGSTTNYYSFLEEETCGASAIFMRKELDSGPLLLRRKWPAASIRDMDHVLDAALRAQVLLETLQHYSVTREWPRVDTEETGKMYYIIHPLLRHIALIE